MDDDKDDAVAASSATPTASPSAPLSASPLDTPTLASPTAASSTSVPQPPKPELSLMSELAKKLQKLSPELVESPPPPKQGENVSLGPTSAVIPLWQRRGSGPDLQPLPPVPSPRRRSSGLDVPPMPSPRRRSSGQDVPPVPSPRRRSSGQDVPPVPPPRRDSFGADGQPVPSPRRRPSQPDERLVQLCRLADTRKLAEIPTVP